MPKNWFDFLKELKESVNVLETRLDRAHKEASKNLFPVQFNSQKVKAEKNEIVIGIGAWEVKCEDGGWVPVLHQGICLNNKKGAQQALKLNHDIPSVTDLVVLKADTTMLSGWKSALAGVSTLSTFFERFTLIVEDAAPDSCFALIAFLANQIYGVRATDIPLEWVEYVRRWEDGDVRTTGEPFSSWGALHSVLAHSCFESAAFEDKSLGATATSSLCRAWIDCLRFDIATLLSEARPHDLTLVQSYPELLKAKAFLSYEYQQYLQSLQHATTLQLLLPMDETGERSKLVDAIIETEHVPLGAQKCFIRNDVEHTWLRAGFALMAIYKPAEASTGNDMTISLDPACGAHLKDLWQRLETLEDERWNNQRPSDQPRVGIVGYPNGKRKDGTNAPNQPWYDDQGHFTLLGAPMKVKTNVGNEPGSRLSWEDVINALWEVYNPVGNLLFNSSNQCACKLYECTESHEETKPIAHSKRFIVVNWIKGEQNHQSILLSPTIKRYFAACINRPHNCCDPIAIRDLPDESTFDFLSIRGGVVVVNESGVLLFDDWRLENPDVKGLRGEFNSVMERFVTIQSVEEELKEIVQVLGVQLTNHSNRISNDINILQRLISLKLKMRQVLTSTLAVTSSMELQRFRECLEQRMGIGRRLEDFYEAAAQLEQTLRDHSELRTNWIISNLTIYGFPLVFFAGFFQFIFQKIPEKVTFGTVVLKPDIFGIHWVGVVSYVLITLLAMLCLRHIVTSRKVKKRPT